MTGAETIPGTVLKDEIVAAGAPWAGIVEKGEVLRIVDLEGQQGVDFLCYNAERPDSPLTGALPHASFSPREGYCAP